MTNLKREIKFVNTIMGLECKFYLKGEKGIIQLCVVTGWDNKASILRAYDVGYHSPVPMYEDQKPMKANSCPFYDPCYYDGSSLYADTVLKILIDKDEESMWQELEKTYERWLCKMEQASA